MTDNLRIRARVIQADSPDYSRPRPGESLEDTYSPTLYYHRIVEMDEVGDAIETSILFSTCDACFIRNIGTKNATVFHDSAAGGGGSNYHDLAAGDILYVPDFTATGDLNYQATTAGETATIEVLLWGT